MADTARVDKEALIALENSEQYHYTLSGNLFNLWLEKKKECDALIEQINLLNSSAAASAESLAIANAQLIGLRAQLSDLEDQMKSCERKARRRGTWGNVKSGIALAIGVFIGSKLK